MDKLDMHSRNLADEKYQILKELFPNAITETKDANGEVVRAIDKDVLMQEISTQVVEGKEERYQFTWPDKKKAILNANAPINKTLRPAREESVNFDETENLYIEGDNLEVLKLLQETYLGKVDVIYIDPPYNTGKDFVYNDDFKESVEEYLENSGQYDEEGNKLEKNPETNGRFHTDWLNMMYSRLTLVKNLLSDEGAVFISIDEREQGNLKKICDEIFGEQNFVSNIIWNKKSGAKGVPPKDMIVNVHEYLLCYQKSNMFKFMGEKRDAEKEGFKNPDNDPRGPWRESNIKSTVKPIETAFVITNPTNGKQYKNTWAFSKESLEKMIEEDRIIWKENLPKQKEFLYEMTNVNKAIKSTWGVFDPQSTTVYLKKLIKEAKFDNPKPLTLMDYLLKVTTTKQSIVLDIFSGSATTAHASMKLNAEDGGNRKYIMVQLPEETDEKSEAYKAGYKTISEIGKERIRRAGKQILEENKNGEEIEKLDIGFRVLKTDSSNMKDVYYSPAYTEQNFLDDLEDNIKEDRTSEDLLFQVMLDLGVSLSSKIESQTIAEKEVFVVEDGFLIACFDKDVSEDTVKEIANKEPYYVVFRDKSMASDSVAANFDQIFASISPETIRKVI
ncbi:site-specific DNA-methyltransferase [Anaerococcus vaginimassiliensis]|uniref:site-specific DNA-methyltransferase n=1 Tax=Anaerococcus vaginimassiliensis TaxID=2042308 RepID=UPI001A92F8FB|nr:site-specific DNA-methyltransferase [Anaerococcus vaginimassiliensis]